MNTKNTENEARIGGSGLNAGLGVIARLREWEDWSNSQTENELADLLGLAANEIERLRKTLQQVLVDAQSQEVLSEWWIPMETALTRPT